MGKQDLVFPIKKLSFPAKNQVSDSTFPERKTVPFIYSEPLCPPEFLLH
jgi:hypothetical protein